jgi:Fe-S cluster assembly protein SufD
MTMNDATSLTKATGRREPADAASALLAAVLAATTKRREAESSWLGAIRRESVSWLESHGFPLPNEESWRFTPIKHLLRTPYAFSVGRPGTLPLDGVDPKAAVIVNGRPEGSLGGVQGVDVMRISEAIEKEPEQVERHLGKLATVNDGFAAANTALFEDGLFVVVRRGAKVGPLHLSVVSAPGAQPTFTTPRILVVAEPMSEVRIVESRWTIGTGPHLDSAVTEVAAGDGARVEYVRLHRGEPSSASLATVAVRLGRDGHFSSRVFTFGGAPARLDLRVAFEGDGGECLLDGLYIARAGDLVDHQTTIDHARPRCTSRERYKGVIGGEGVAVFDGTVVVRPGASGTEAHQENRNLCLSPDAVVHAKPHLEIDTDDVKCSHGATVGRLDPAQLFYLRARGLDADVARSVLTFAFAREMVEPISDDVLRNALENTIAGLLPGGAMARELA